MSPRVRPAYEFMGKPPKIPKSRWTPARLQKLVERNAGKEYFILPHLYLTQSEIVSLECTLWSLWGITLDLTVRPFTYSPKATRRVVCRAVTLEQLDQWDKLLKNTPTDTNDGNYRQQDAYRKRVKRMGQLLTILRQNIELYKQRKAASEAIDNESQHNANHSAYICKILPTQAMRGAFAQKCRSLRVTLDKVPDKSISRHHAVRVITPVKLAEIKAKYKAHRCHEDAFDLYLAMIQDHFDMLESTHEKETK